MIFYSQRCPFTLVYSTVCFPSSSSKVVSMVGKFHGLEGNYTQYSPE